LSYFECLSLLPSLYRVIAPPDAIHLRWPVQFNFILPPDHNRADSRGEDQCPLNLGAKAVLKTPQSTRWRDCRGASDCAKRLECGAFTAAFRVATTAAMFKVQGAGLNRALVFQFRRF
jgi:hypothetical protein